MLEYMYEGIQRRLDTPPFIILSPSRTEFLLWHIRSTKKNALDVVLAQTLALIAVLAKVLALLALPKQNNSLSYIEKTVPKRSRFFILYFRNACIFFLFRNTKKVII